MLHKAHKLLAGVGVHGKLHGHAFLDAADIGFIHVGGDLHLVEVVGDGEERGGTHTCRNGLSRGNFPGDDHAIDGGGDGGIAQVLFRALQGKIGVVKGLFRLPVGKLRLLQVILGRVTFGGQALVVFKVQPGLVEGQPGFVHLEARGFQVGAEDLRIQFGKELAFAHPVVKILVNLVDAAGDFGAHLHQLIGVDGAGGGHHFTDRAHRGFVCPPLGTGTLFADLGIGHHCDDYQQGDEGVSEVFLFHVLFFFTICPTVSGKAGC